MSEASRADDERFMRRALELAREGLGLASPNPMVGAVVVADGEVLGEGWHEGPGTPHAELAALRAVGERARGATLYVTLEPCGHRGRTPACAPRVVAAGIERVVASVRDPNPLVDGAGFAILREAGVTVDVGVLDEEGRRLIEAFATAVTTGMPFVTLKMASSLDGRVAARDGSSRWITGEEARLDVHRLRAASDAVVVGAGTTLADDPSLTVRLDGYRGRQPLRVIVDASGRVPAKGPLFDGEARTVVITTDRCPPEAVDGWSAAGAGVHRLPAEGPAGSVPLATMLREVLVGCHAARSVLIEGGPTLAWSAVRERVVDRFVLYLSPKLIGGSSAPGVLGGEGIETIANAVPLDIESVERIGEDLRIAGRPRRGEGA